MVIDKYFKPSPHDFGEFVYCGVKWVLNQKSSSSKETINKNSNLSLGQQNETKCIDWVRNKYSVSKEQILFDGTGKNNNNFLTSKIQSVSISMHCQPDLIISKDNQNLLFEFKAVSVPDYLSLPEFDSVHAQVWCYSNLKEIQIDEYHLLRYFIDPCSNFSFSFSNKFFSTYRHKELTPYELDPYKFETLFEKYIETIELLRQNNPDTKKLVLTKFKGTKAKKLVLDLFNPTKENTKCNNCTYKRKGKCEINTSQEC